MTVPEAAVHEDDRVVTWQSNIGTSGKTLHMKSKAEAHAMRHASNAQLRQRVPRPDCGHHRTSSFRVHDVHE
jgi:hypothetical protein